MAIELPVLPFDKSDLVPHISEETIDFHYGKHHKTYVDKLNLLIEGTEFANMDLEEIIKKSEGGVFNNAAQVWNHNFYWECLCKATTDKKISPDLMEEINKTFGSFDGFVEEFTKSAVTLFGSGWVWLIKDSDGLSIVQTSNADTPMRSGKKPILTCDMWEHAYYIDYRNVRPEYMKNFWELVNWEFISKNFSML